MKTRYALILLLISSTNFAQTPLPYARLNENYKNSAYDTSGMYWYEYDASNLEKAGTFQIWNTALNKLLNTTRYEMKRNGDGNIILSYNFSWNLGNESWDTSSRTVYTYYKKDRVATIEINSYQAGWKNLELDSNFYDANDKLIHKKIYWNTSPTSYAYAGQHFYHYNVKDTLEQFLYLWINANGITWDTISRYSYSYNSSPKVDTVIWEDYYQATGWKYSNKTFSIYKGIDQLESIVSMNWNNSLNNWINASQDLYKYYADTSPDQVLHEQWDKVEKTYLPLSRTTYLYGNPIGMDEYIFSSDFNIYPNPSEGELTFNFTSDLKNETLRIMSQDGRLMHRHMLNGRTYHVDIASWANGIYYAIIGEGQHTAVKKVVKQ